MPNWTSTWMVSELKAASIAATGHSKKSVLTGTSKMTLSIPRDRAGTFDPKLIAKYQRRFPDFDDKIISMYARGMSVREIRGHLEELYGIDDVNRHPVIHTWSYKLAAVA